MKSESDILLLHSIIKKCADNDSAEYPNKVLQAVVETLELILREDKLPVQSQSANKQK